MFLQGHLQTVFDALYQMGVIDPVLDMDWVQALDDLPMHYQSFHKALEVANSSTGDIEELIVSLEQFDESTLAYLAMEVAREFADYHSREVLH